MIDRQGAKILIECSTCDKVFSGDDHEEFKEVWAAAKREGWRTKKIGFMDVPVATSSNHGEQDG